MTTHSLPPEFDLHPERFRAQRRLLVTTVASERGRARVVRPRLVFLAAALLLAVLLVSPAFGIGSRLVHAFTGCPVSRCGSPPPSPSEAQKQTGVAPTTHLRTDYDGVDYSVVTYEDAQGRLCVASLAGSSQAGYGCDQGQAELANGSLVALLGPSWMQEPNRPGFAATLSDRLWL